MSPKETATGTRFPRNEGKVPKLSVRKGREYQLRRGHPWLFSGAISQAPGGITPGSIIELIDVDGNFIARGYYNPACDIAVRVLTTDRQEAIDQEFLAARVKQARRLRQMRIDETTDAFRLINAEGDFLPGFIADFYAGVVVVQSHTAGADRLLEPFLEALKEEIQPQAIIVRNDAGVRRREGLEVQEPYLAYGSVPDRLVIQENGWKFLADPMKGQKTGFFTDQRDKRWALAQYCRSLAAGSTLANCFSYSAGFSIAAVTANSGIKTINIDESAKALELAKENFALNNLDSTAHEFVADDVFKWLENYNHPSHYDVMILDPPAFAKSKKDNERALKAYSKLNQSGIAVTKSGGLLVTCSCSGTITLDDLRQCAHEGAGRAGRKLQLLEVFEHGCDHPINIAAPESAYLKVLFCRVV